ncbi:hypothetical protein REPUB_Repub14bG0157100 [Reevesia pubescens]
MGAKVSKYFSSKREAKALMSSNVGSNSSQRSSIIEAIKPECLKKRKMKKNQMKIRQLQSPEKRITKVRKLTLEDWLLASPGPAGLNRPDCLNEGGELYVFKHFSRRVYPSSSREREDVPSTPGDSFSMDLSSGDVSRSSFKRSQSGKLKKKVSFRLPEEADIVIFHSPAETFGSDQQSF